MFAYDISYDDLHPLRTQVGASFISPFGHPTQVDASCLGIVFTGVSMRAMLQ